MQTWKQIYSSKGLRHGLFGLSSVWAIAFVVCAITTVYDNHAALVSSNAGLRSQNSQLQDFNKKVISERDELQKKLTVFSEELRKAQKPRQAPPTPTLSSPPTIQSMLVEVRLTCPPKAGMTIEQGDFDAVIFEKTRTELVGPAGNFALRWLSPFRIRVQDDGRGVLIDRYSLADDSQLIGRPLETLQSFEKLVVQVRVPVQAASLDKPTFAEIEVKVNGDEYWYMSSPAPLGHDLSGLEITVPIRLFRRQ